jgi:uncharacterized protein (DUF1697 family)
MGKFVALLRGINVSGQKKIKMSGLKVLFEDLSFTNIETYIQSGNVLFNCSTNSKKVIGDKIKRGIASKFGYQVHVIIKTPDELGYALKNNAFLKSKTKDLEKIYFTFLSEVPSQEKIQKLKEVDSSSEKYILDGTTIYLFFPSGYGKAKMNNNFFEKKLNVFATTRNYKTVKTLFEMSKSK